jgi:hypothetical protein
MNDALGTIAAVVSAIIGLAIVAVLVSNQAQTGTVLTSAGSALGTVIGAAVAPVTGANGSSMSGTQLTNTGGSGGGGYTT